MSAQDDGVFSYHLALLPVTSAVGALLRAPTPATTPKQMARVSDASAFTIVELPVGWQGGWHPSPQAQWVICLAGEMGYQAEDGTRFTLKPGTCILTTDTRGKGHDSWNAGDDPVRLALVQLR